MKIDISPINRKEFDISERFIDGNKFYLITPTKDKHLWSLDELHLRSVLCDAEYNVVSSGFNKFFNVLEKPELDLISYEAIHSGKAWFVEKMDGSLLIRSVINGKVHFRTRGSHTVEEDFALPIMKMIREKYPNLLDPAKDSHYSILFEYTGPDNKIILDYANPALTVLGMMDLTAEPPEFLSSPEILAQLESDYGIPAVKFYDLSGTPESVMDQIRGWKDREGVVLWYQQPNGKMHLAKIKTAEYVRLHSLKYSLTDRKVLQFCWFRNVTSLDSLKEEFYKLGVDWEAVSFVEPIYNEYMSRRHQVEEEVGVYFAEIDKEEIAKLPNRKEIAIRLKDLNSELFHIGIQYVFGDKEKTNKLIDARILGISEAAFNYFKKEAAEFVEYLSTPKIQEHE